MHTIKANWKAPSNILALTTTRLGGNSLYPYDSNNLGLNTGDVEAAVITNRTKLHQLLNLPGEIQWLQQTHSTECVIVEEDSNRIADAAVSRSQNMPLAILTADCVPIVITNIQGTEIAAVHAGWRGLAQGVIENTLLKMHSHPQELMAWIGPAICHKCFEIGDEVYQIFINNYPQSQSAFYCTSTKWHAHLNLIAQHILNNLGVTHVFQSNRCTFESQNELFSYRRQAQTGRIATLIWFNN